MSKLKALAERIADTKQRLEDRADEIGRRLDEVDRIAPATFERAHSFLDSQEADVQSLHDGLSRLTNLPLDEYDNSQKGSPDA